MHQATEPVEEKGNFDVVKDYIIKYIKDAKPVSNSVPDKLYCLNLGYSGYRSKLKKKIEHFPMQLCFATA